MDFALGLGSSGTSCPPQPNLEVISTPPFLMYLEIFLRGDQSMKVACCNPMDTPGPPGPGSMKVVSYDPSDIAGPSGSSPTYPQPHLHPHS